jgi:GntR family transcriptional regulator
LDPGAPVYRFVRTRYVNDEPLANQTNFIPFEVCPGLEDDDVSNFSFKRLLEEKYLAILSQLQESHQITQADAQDAHVLGVSPGSLLVLVERISLSPTGYPMVWASIRIRPDHFQYVAALWPAAAELLEEVRGRR